jgi:hypothetical protein
MYICIYIWRERERETIHRIDSAKMLGVSDPSTKYLRTATWYHLYHYLNHSILASAVSSCFMWDGRPRGPTTNPRMAILWRKHPIKAWVKLVKLQEQPKTSQQFNIRVLSFGLPNEDPYSRMLPEVHHFHSFSSSFWTASTAVRMVEAWRRPDAFTFSSLLAACHRSQRWEVAQGLLRDMPLTQAQELHSLGNPKVWDCVDSDFFLMVWCFMWFANI